MWNAQNNRCPQQNDLKYVYGDPGTIAGTGAGKLTEVTWHHAHCVHILSHSWKLMSLATCQSLMNSSPSALKQPEFCRRGRLEQEEGKEGTWELLLLREKLWWENCPLHSHSLWKPVWCFIHLNHRQREQAFYKQHYSRKLCSPFLIPSKVRKTWTWNELLICLLTLFFVFKLTTFSPGPPSSEHLLGNRWEAAVYLQGRVWLEVPGSLEGGAH